MMEVPWLTVWAVFWVDWKHFLLASVSSFNRLNWLISLAMISTATADVAAVGNVSDFASSS